MRSFHKCRVRWIIKCFPSNLQVKKEISEYSFDTKPNYYKIEEIAQRLIKIYYSYTPYYLIQESNIQFSAFLLTARLFTLFLKVSSQINVFRNLITGPTQT
jgi:hypothetical protein